MLRSMPSSMLMELKLSKYKPTDAATSSLSRTKLRQASSIQQEATKLLSWKLQCHRNHHSIIKSNSINQVQVTIAQVYLRRNCQTSVTELFPYPKAIFNPTHFKTQVQSQLPSPHKVTPPSNPSQSPSRSRESTITPPSMLMHQFISLHKRL